MIIARITTKKKKRKKLNTPNKFKTKKQQLNIHSEKQIKEVLKYFQCIY